MMSAWRKSIVRPFESVTRPSSRICKQDRGDVGVRFLEFVEEHDAIRTPTNRLGQLARFVVSGIARWRAKQPRDRMRLGELGEIDAHQRRFAAEEHLGERFRELRLADAARSAKEKAADGLTRIVQTGSGPPNRLRHRRNRAFLTDHALCKQHCSRSSSSPACDSVKRRLRNAGPARNDRSDVFAAHAWILDCAFVRQAPRTRRLHR